MDSMVGRAPGVAGALDQLAAFFAGQRTRPGLLARERLGTAAPDDEALAERLVMGLRGETRIDGSVGGAVLPTIWLAHELMDLGHAGDQAGTVRVMGFVLNLGGKPGAFGEGCDPTRHRAGVCEHFMEGFFSVAPVEQRVAPVTMPNGKVYRAEPAARFAVSCLALRAALRARHEARPMVDRHVRSLVRLQDRFTEWNGYFSPDVILASLHALSFAPPPHRELIPQAAAFVAAQQQEDGTWANADFFLALEALTAANTPEAREAIARAVPALLALQREDGSFGGPAREERALIALRALLYAG
jgi:hypothetical protein